MVEIEIKIYAIGNLLTAGNGFFKSVEGRVHFLRTAQVELVAFHFHPVRVRAKLAGVDTEQYILSFGIFTPDVVAITSGN